MATAPSRRTWGRVYLNKEALVSKVKKKPVWFVDPEVKRIQLPDDFWIDCKRQLTVKESRMAMAAAVDVDGFGKITPRLDKLGLTEVAAYVVDWNLTDSSGNPVPFSREALDNLHVEGFKAIEDAVKAHVQEMSSSKKPNANTSNPDSASVD